MFSDKCNLNIFNTAGYLNYVSNRYLQEIELNFLIGMCWNVLINCIWRMPWVFEFLNDNII